MDPQLSAVTPLLAMSQKASSSPADDERRDSPRVALRLLVRPVGSDTPWEGREGDISVGGFAWYGGGMSPGQRVEVRFLLPGGADELKADGEVLRVSHGPRGPTAHVRFLDLPVACELAIARYLDDLRLGGALSGS